MATNNKIKVLVVDDSALIRQSITVILKNNPFVEVVGTAFNPIFASKKIQTLRPDVILLDIQMPEMDGLTFLQKIMNHQPLPVIIFSSYAEEGSYNALKALEFGAVEIIEKPKLRISTELEKYKTTLLRAIKIASIAKISKVKQKKSDVYLNFNFNTDKVSLPPPNIIKNNFVIAIGASTGGTEAIRRVLERIPENFPPIVIAQHMPVGFTKSFANRLNQLSIITVKEAENNDVLQNGHAYVARGDRHLTLNKVGIGYQVKLDNSSEVNRHKPSVQVLFDSVTEVYGKNAIGIILTGMGADGAEGLKRMRQKGAHTIAQNAETCVVFGMPKVAIKKGGADVVLPIFQITDYLIELLKNKFNKV